MHNYHIIDSGNTNLKVATFDKAGNIVNRIDSLLPEDLDKFITNNSNDYFASCSVNLNITTSEKIESFEKVKGTLDFKSRYSNQIGSDRFAICYSLQKQYPTDSLAIISAGTFTTVDFIKDGVHLGGYIFPGVQTYLNSYSAGAKLPILMPKDRPSQKQYPQSTDEAILSSLACFMDSITYLTKDFKTVVTGGASHFFEINGELDKNLLFKSLFYIFINTTWSSK
ncbi:type III pantothenate kinase [Bacteriovorax sp. Seq25_V]|uniref:type III pantothenate kinase n=1 Tax=Bacteriovorax sp. Seq25_V TaxID=1201288 RepID=UPI00038A03C3|nr:type III pantothenate kinase [Bacteriovorax sp. Seq25_V]EQC47244.1 pantothenate kinase, type III [Bacteriovorax sp. Seq25_V]